MDENMEETSQRGTEMMGKARHPRPMWDIDNPRDLLTDLLMEVVVRVSPEAPQKWEEIKELIKNLQLAAETGKIDRLNAVLDLKRLSSLVLNLDSEWSTYETERQILAGLAAPFVVDAFRRDPLREMEEICQEVIDNLLPVLRKRQERLGREE